MKLAVPVLLIALAAGAGAQSPTPTDVDALHRPFDEILDLYVRDGLVYYHALKLERGRFDRYVAALGEVGGDTLRGWAPGRQLAYWINAYNAFVLRTVIDHYPIRGKSPDYQVNSILLTLDAIERDVIGEFNDARALLALGRGAVGGPRVKSEAFTAARLDSQLETMQNELVTRRDLVFVDIGNERLSVNPLFSWREAIFVRSLAERAPAAYAARSPLERSVLALIDRQLVPNESAFLRKNTFRMVFHDFDWTLNDLTGR
jgi:hypothetical protein